MNQLYALGVFMNHANNNWSQTPQNQALFQRVMREILGSPQDRFINCSSVYDLLSELGIGANL